MWMDTAEHPQLRAGELLIRVKRAAICGTDVHIYKWDEWSQRCVPACLGGHGEKREREGEKEEKGHKGHKSAASRSPHPRPLGRCRRP